MSEGWQVSTLGDVLQPVSRPEPVAPTKEYRLLGVRLDGAGPFLRETKLGSQSAATTLFEVKADDFIYSRLFAWRGAFGIISPELDGCYVSSEFPIFHPVPGKIDMEFLRLWFRLPRTLAAVEAVCSGSTPLTRNRFKETFFLRMQIPLPPLPEQCRIVGRIEELAGKIEEVRGLRREAVEESGFLAGKTAAVVFDECKEQFGIVTLGSLCETTSGGTPSRDRFDFYSGDIPWVKSGELEDAIITSAEEHITPSAVANSSAKIFPKGTLLVALYGATVGKTGILGLDAATNQAVCAVFPNASLQRDYIWRFLKRMRPEYISMSFGGAQPNISQKVIRDTLIPYPPLPEQERIVAYLDGLQAKVDVLKALQGETEKELAALLPSVLDRAFSGRL